MSSVCRLGKVTSTAKVTMWEQEAYQISCTGEPAGFLHGMFVTPMFLVCRNSPHTHDKMDPCLSIAAAVQIGNVRVFRGQAVCAA